MRRTFLQIFKIELRFSCHVFDRLVLLVAHCSTCCHLMVPSLRPGAEWMIPRWRGVFCAIRDAVLEARAFTGEPLYTLSCLPLTCRGASLATALKLIRYDTIRYDTIRYDTIRYDTMLHTLEHRYITRSLVSSQSYPPHTSQCWR